MVKSAISVYQKEEIALNSITGTYNIQKATIKISNSGTTKNALFHNLFLYVLHSSYMFLSYYIAISWKITPLFFKT